MAKGGKVQALTEAVNALEKELVKTKTQLEISEGTVKDDAKRVEAAKKATKEVSTDPINYAHPHSYKLHSRSARPAPPLKPLLSQSSVDHSTKAPPSLPSRKNYSRPSSRVWLGKAMMREQEQGDTWVSWRKLKLPWRL